LNGAYGAAYLGLRRVEKLLAEGKPIPPTAAQQGDSEKQTKRRWSAMAMTRKRYAAGADASHADAGAAGAQPHVHAGESAAAPAA